MDIVEINEEITKLEKADTNYTNCGKLATLYTVKNGLDIHSKSTQNVGSYGYSYASEPESEFIQAFKAAPEQEALQVLDKHMQCIKALYPREYKTILNKLFSMIL